MRGKPGARARACHCISLESDQAARTRSVIVSRGNAAALELLSSASPSSGRCHGRRNEGLRVPPRDDCGTTCRRATLRLPCLPMRTCSGRLRISTGSRTRYRSRSCFSRIIWRRSNRSYSRLWPDREVVGDRALINYRVPGRHVYLVDLITGPGGGGKHNSLINSSSPPRAYILRLTISACVHARCVTTRESCRCTFVQRAIL